MKAKRRILSLLLCAAMLFSTVPQTAAAEGTQDSGAVIGTSGGLCEHHTQHDESCGYTEGTAGTPCTHEHTEGCYTLVTNCVHEHTAECYPADSVSGNTATPSDAEGAEPTACAHVCSEENGCITRELNCQHTHDGSCGYSEGTAGTPCGYVCGICNSQDSGEPEGTEPEAGCVCTTLCTEGSVNGDCPVCSAAGAGLTACQGEAQPATPSNAIDEAVQNVQDLIDALPALSDMESMSDDEREAAIVQYTEAYEAYEALTDEQKAQVTGAEVFDEFLALMNAGTTLAEEIGAFTVTGGTYGTDYSYADGVLTILTNTPLTISNTDSGTAASDRIVIGSGVSAVITLDGINISSSSSPIDIPSGASADITLAAGSTNTVTATGSREAGIHVPSGASLTIRCGAHTEDSACDGGDGCGTLSARGRSAYTYDSGHIGAGGGAGIGGDGGYECSSSEAAGSITIHGGKVTATGSANSGSGYGTAGGGAGIGGGGGGFIKSGAGSWGYGGNGGSCGTVTINGGSVSATGVCGIGGGNRGSSNSSGSAGNGGTVYMTGGTLNGVSTSSSGTFYFSNATLTGCNIQNSTVNITGTGTITDSTVRNITGWVDDNYTVSGSTLYFKDATTTLTKGGEGNTYNSAVSLTNGVTFTGDTNFGGNVTVNTEVSFPESVTIGGDLTVSSVAKFEKDLTVKGTTIVQETASLTIGGNATFSGGMTSNVELTIPGNATFGGNTVLNKPVSVTGDAIFNGATTLGDTLSVGGSNATFGGNTVLNKPVSVTGDAIFNGATTLGDTLSVGGSVTFAQNVTIDKEITIGKDATFKGGVTGDVELTIPGNATFGGNAILNKPVSVTGAATLNGTVELNANLTIGGGAFNSNVTIPNGITVTNSGTLTIPTNVTVTNNGNIQNQENGTIMLEGTIDTTNGSIANNGTIYLTGDGNIIGNTNLTGNAPMQSGAVNVPAGEIVIDMSTVTSTVVINPNTYSINGGESISYDPEKNTIVLTGTYKGNPGSGTDSNYAAVVKITERTAATVILRDATIARSASRTEQIQIQNDCTITLLLEGENTVRSNQFASAIRTMETTALTIDGSGTLNLNATGDSDGPCIGSHPNYADGLFGTIRINGGTFITNVSRSGNYSCGAFGGKTGTIEVNGGTIKGNSFIQSAAQYKQNIEVIINGGVLEIEENDGSYTYQSIHVENGSFTMNGGTVTMPKLMGKTITINGGQITLTCIHEYAYWGNKSGGTITVNGGTVTPVKYRDNILKINGGSVYFSGKAVNIANSANGTAYRTVLEEQANVASVMVDGVNQNISANHSDTNTSLYLYLVHDDANENTNTHTITVMYQDGSLKEYTATWDSDNSEFTFGTDAEGNTTGTEVNPDTASSLTKSFTGGTTTNSETGAAEKTYGDAVPVVVTVNLENLETAQTPAVTSRSLLRSATPSYTFNTVTLYCNGSKIDSQEVKSSQTTVIFYVQTQTWAPGTYEFTATYGGNSSVKKAETTALPLTILGQPLSGAGALTVTAPTLSGTYGTAVSSLTLSNGSVTLDGTAVSGSWSIDTEDNRVLPVDTDATVALTFTPYNTKYEPVTANVTPTISPKTVTASIVSQGGEGSAITKGYDGDTDASDVAKIKLDGVLESDAGNVSATYNSLAYGSADVGGNIAITASGLRLNGGAAGNYMLASNQAETTGSITAAGLTGDVTIDGSAVYGENLTANYSVSGETVSYQWYRQDGETTTTPIDGATDKTYPLTADDIGKTITVTVTGTENYSGSKTSTATAAVEKATPADPATGTGYTIDYGAESISATDGCELADSSTADSGKNSLTLTPGYAAYNVYVRLKETTTHKESGWVAVSIPARPTIAALSISNTAEGVTVPEGYYYGTEAADYSKITTPGPGSNVSVAAGSSIYIYRAATGNAFKSQILTLAAPAKAEQPNVEINYATEKMDTTTAMQYKVGDGGWTACTADMNVTAFGWDGATEVSVQFRTAATDGADGKYASEPQTVKIPARPAAPTGGITVTNKTSGSITVQTETGQAYSIDGETWNTTGEFTGLEASQQYTIYTRFSAVTEGQKAFASHTSSKQVTTLGTDGSGTVEPGETATLPDGATITNDGGTVTIDPEGDGPTTTVTLPEDKDDVTIGGGGVTVPEGSTVETGGKGPEIGLPDGGTIDPETGGVTLPDDGEATIENEDGTTATITTPEGGEITPDGEGGVTLPGGATVQTGDGDPVTIPEGGGSITPEGALKYDVTVTFNSQGGSLVDSATVTVGNTVSRPTPDPTREGYAFGGWYKEEACANEWDFAADTVDGTMTLFAKWLSTDAGVTTVKIGETAGAIDGTTFTIVLPYGSSLPTGGNDFTIETAAGATASTPTTSDGGATWTFTVTAEDGKTRTEYTVKVSIAENPAAGNIADVAAAKSAIDNADWTTAQATANTEAAVKAWIEEQLAAMSLNGVSYTVTIDSFTAATAGSAADRDGTDGSFTFTVSLSKGTDMGSTATSTYASDRITKTGAITATAYNKWTVTVTAGSGGTATGGGTFEDGLSVTVTASANSGYRFVRWEENGAQVSTSASYTFTLTADRSLTAVFERRSTGGGGGGTTTPTYTNRTLSHNGVSVAGTGIHRSARLTVTADKLHDTGSCGECDKIRQWQAEGRVIAVYDVSMSQGFQGNITITFPVPASYNGRTLTVVHCRHERLDTHRAAVVNGTISVTVDGLSPFAILDDKDNPDTGFTNPFTDVSEGNWFYDDVMYVYQNGLMNGTSATTFSPDEPTTRAQIAVIFYRMDGSPEVTGDSAFTDVEYGPGTQWYYNAVLWAQQNGIVSGYGDGTFHPERNITREQIAVIFYNYASYKGYDTTASSDLSGFTDAGKVSSWALPAMRWAVGSGVMGGYGDGILGPQETATRAQVAAMLRRFIENNRLVPPAVLPGGGDGATGGGDWTQQVTSPLTGDSGNMELWTSLMLLSGAGLCTTGAVARATRRRRKHRRDEDKPVPDGLPG